MNVKQYNSEQPFNYAFRRLRLRAKQKKLLFDLDEQFIVDIWTGTCAIFGTPLCMPYSTKSQDPNKATIDRVLPELGYTKGNVRWVSNRANIIKSFGNQQDHETIVEYFKNSVAILEGHTKGIFYFDKENKS